MTRTLYENDLSTLTDAQLMELLNNSIQAMVDGIPEDLASISGAFPAYQGLMAVCKKWLTSEDGALTHRLLMGTGHVDSADPGMSLLEIAMHSRSFRELTECIYGENVFRALREKAAGLEGGASFLRLWDDFMEKHGHHARGELEFFNPRWAECPDYVLSIVKGYIENLDSLDMKAVYEKRVQERQSLIRECRGRLINPIHRVVFDYLLSKAQQGLALRERYKNEAVKKIAAYRLIYLELGGRYAARGVLDRQDDIFFLYGNELGALHQGTLSIHVKETIAGRRREYDKNLAVIPHPVVVGTRENRNYVSFGADVALAVFTGIAVSHGIARGPARVCVSKDDDISISPGEILVIPFADPGWSPYFIPAAGIVMDMGGILSHGSIIAREYGIPTVVNVGTATRMIKTGQVVEVDGNSGTVRVIA
jgi:pyruvate,water dikinase